MFFSFFEPSDKILGYILQNKHYQEISRSNDQSHEKLLTLVVKFEREPGDLLFGFISEQLAKSVISLILGVFFCS